MSESNADDRFINDKSEELKKKRRTRNDEDGRNFTCTCGKSYLSYPALYTHIKTKHNGKAEFGKMVNMKQDDINYKEDQEIQFDEKFEEADNLEILRKYLTKFFPYTQKDKDSDKKVKELTKEDAAYLKGIKQYWQIHKKSDQPHENEVYSTSIDHVLGKFLISIQNDVSKSCQKYLSDFVINMKNAINSLKSKDKGDQFCSTTFAAGIPNLMNEIFSEKFQKMEEGHIYIRHPTIICKTLFHFNRWLFQQRFTNLSLKFNTV